jgi:hypothetical protein
VSKLRPGDQELNEHELKFFKSNKNAKNAKYVTELSLLRKAVHQLKRSLKYTTEEDKTIRLQRAKGEKEEEILKIRKKKKF